MQAISIAHILEHYSMQITPREMLHFHIQTGKWKSGFRILSDAADYKIGVLN